MESNPGTSVEATFPIASQVQGYTQVRASLPRRTYSFFEGVDHERVARMTGKSLADISDQDICNASFNEVFLSRLESTRTKNPVLHGLTTFLKYACLYFYNIGFQAQKAAIPPHTRKKYEKQ